MLYFYDTDDIKNKIKTETDGKDVLLMSYQKLFRTAASSVITYLEDKDIDILIFDESHRMGAKTVREKWDPIVSYCIKQGIKVVGGTATDVRADGISVTEQFFNECSVFPYTLGDAVSDGLIQLPWYIAAVNTEARRVTAWLKDIPVKTDISVLLDARVWCSSTKIQYHGRSTPAYCVLREKDTDAISFYNALKDLSGDLSEVIDLKFANTGTVYTFRGMVLNYAGIAYYLGTATSHIAEKLRGKSREEAELELAQHNSDYIKHPVLYEWEGELLHAATISRRLGSRTNALSSIILPPKMYTSFSGILLIEYSLRVVMC